MHAKLKVLLAEAGYSVAAYAREIDVPQSTLQRIVSGQVDESAISVGTFFKIAHGLGLTAEELFYDDTFYADDKREVDLAFTHASEEGRRAMVACARGVLLTYPSADECLLPEIGEGIPDFRFL